MDIVIRFADRSVTRQWLQDNEQAAQALMRQHYGIYPVCNCVPNGVPMYIGRRQTYYLATMPGRITDHHPACPSHGTGTRRSGQDKAKDAVTQDGELTYIQTSAAIRRAAANNQHHLADRQAHQSIPRNTIRLRSVLLHLWQQAQFNLWSPGMKGHRRYQQIRKYLLQASSTLFLNGICLTDILYIPPTFIYRDKAAHKDRVCEVISKIEASARSLGSRMVVIGHIKDYCENEYGIGIKLRHDTVNTFWMNERTQRSFRHHRCQGGELPAIPDDLNLFCIMTVESTDGGYYKVDTLGEIATSQQFIPVDSSYELQFCHHLVEQDRRFMKPLEMHPDTDMLADFILLDTEGEIHIEIYGMDGMGEYTQRKKEKIAAYEATGVRYWAWDLSVNKKWGELPNG